MKKGCMRIGGEGQHSRLYYDGYTCSWCQASAAEEAAELVAGRIAEEANDASLTVPACSLPTTALASTGD